MAGEDKQQKPSGSDNAAGNNSNNTPAAASNNNNNATPNAGTSQNVNRVAVKVPPFWPEHAEIWLAQVEAQFAVAGLTSDDSKFNTVVAAIESNVLVQISDAILNPPEKDKYGNLKKCIKERYCESEQKKTQKLLSVIDLGDKRPTQLLNELSSLAGDKVTRGFLKSLWLQRLPAQVRAILQTSDVDLNDLAKLADSIMEVGDYQHLSAVSSSGQLPSSSGASDVDKRLARIEQQISSLCQNINTDGKKRRSRSASAKRQNISTRRNSSANVGDQLCWFHHKYGANARKCREPCTYPNNSTKN